MYYNFNSEKPSVFGSVKYSLLLLLLLLEGYWLASLFLFPWKLGFCYGGHSQSHVGKETKKIGCIIIIIVTLWFGRCSILFLFLSWGLVHAGSFGSVGVVRGDPRDRDLNSSSLSFGFFCAALVARGTQCESGLGFC